MAYYQITYLTDYEQRKTAYIEAGEEIMLPFLLRIQDKHLEKVLDKKTISKKEYDNARSSIAPLEKTTPSKKAPAVESPVISSGIIDLSEAKRLFAHDGKIGRQYVICNKVCTIKAINDGSVSVLYYGTSVAVQIARLTEMEPFDPKVHSKLLVRQKKEKEDN